jgi:hypothetical protein
MGAIERTKCRFTGLMLAKNVVVIITGLCTGMIGVCMTRGVGWLMEWRNETIERMLDASPGNFVTPFFVNVLYGLGLVAVGAIMVRSGRRRTAPLRSGSCSVAGTAPMQTGASWQHVHGVPRERDHQGKVASSIAFRVRWQAFWPQWPRIVWAQRCPARPKHAHTPSGCARSRA